MPILTEIAKDFRQATIRVIVAAFLPTLGATLLFLWSESREWTISHTTREQMYYIAVSLFGLLGASLSWLALTFWNRSSLGEVVVVSATWGKRESQKDVTDFVRKHIADGRLDVLASNSTFDIRSPEEDPAYKHNKNLKVHAKIKGIPNTYFAPEGDHLRLP